MTVLSPPVYEFKVEELDEFGRESRIEGRCSWTDATGYIVALTVINLLILVMAGWESYKARNLSTEFSESQYLFRALVSTLTVAFVGIPLVLLTEDNPTALAFASSAIVFVSSTSILLFIFLPKMNQVGQLRAGGGASRNNPGGIGMGVEKGPRWKVSGLESGPSGIYHNRSPISAAATSPVPFLPAAHGVRYSTIPTAHSSSDLKGMKILTIKSKSELLQENEILEAALEELKQLIESSESMETLRAALVPSSQIPSFSNDDGCPPLPTIDEPNECQ